ncbi:MAG: Crp/Fnr family transcriptional regulator [Actinomycetota bacterium]|nr:Crp/Fnr family transcriptional regulator [Actinomycetota bacterium]
MSAPSRVTNVLDEDRDLAEHLSGTRLEEARRDAVAHLMLVHVGEWSPTEGRRSAVGALGLLILEGMLARKTSIGGRPSLELFGAGDLLRPSDEAGSLLIRPQQVHWWALTPIRLAVLDARFTSRMCSYPEVIEALNGRLERRSSTHALRLAIMQQPHLSERLHLLLWHLADQFGQVHPEGVVLAIPLTHGLLAQLVGARRPSVSGALKELERATLVVRRPDGSWLLGGAPPKGADPSL